jgi:hypothetical protein
MYPARVEVKPSSHDQVLTAKRWAVSSRGCKLTSGDDPFRLFSPARGCPRRFGPLWAVFPGKSAKMLLGQFGTAPEDLLTGR